MKKRYDGSKFKSSVRTAAYRDRIIRSDALVETESRASTTLGVLMVGVAIMAGILTNEAAASFISLYLSSKQKNQEDLESPEKRIHSRLLPSPIKRYFVIPAALEGEVFCEPSQLKSYDK